MKLALIMITLFWSATSHAWGDSITPSYPNPKGEYKPYPNPNANRGGYQPRPTGWNLNGPPPYHLEISIATTVPKEFNVSHYDGAKIRIVDPQCKEIDVDPPTSEFMGYDDNPKSKIFPIQRIKSPNPNVLKACHAMMAAYEQAITQFPSLNDVSTPPKDSKPVARIYFIEYSRPPTITDATLEIQTFFYPEKSTTQSYMRASYGPKLIAAFLDFLAALKINPAFPTLNPIPGFTGKYLDLKLQDSK